MESALEALGKGFDLTNDFRLRFAKGSGRLLVLDDVNKRDLLIPHLGTMKCVSQDIRVDKGDRIRFKSDVLQFNQMSELLNQKSSIQGKVPSGYLNAIFDLSGDWFHDVADTKYLAFDGYFISLYNFHLTTSRLVLQDQVKKSVPPHWDPALLARFILTYGTHIVVGMAVGGQDLICVKQNPSSPIPPADLRRHLEDLSDYLFSEGKSPSLLQRKTRDRKQKVPEVFNRILQSNTMQLSCITETSSKDGLTIICSKRGGDVFVHSHSNWLQTVPAKPEGILFKFVPISSLLTGIPGSGYLSHAINLYLRSVLFQTSRLQGIYCTSWSFKFLGNGHLCSVSFLFGINKKRVLVLPCNSVSWVLKFVSALHSACSGRRTAYSLNGRGENHSGQNFEVKRKSHECLVCELWKK